MAYQKTIELISQSEGLASVVKGKTVTTRDISDLDKLIYPYQNPGDVPTIGYGNTWYENRVKVKMTDSPITIRRAIELRNNIIEIFEKPVRQLLINANENQIAAITSVSYQYGSSHDFPKLLIKKHNDGTIRQSDFTSKGQFLERRNKEWQVYNTPVSRPTAINVKGIMAKIEKILNEEIEIKLW